MPPLSRARCARRSKWSRLHKSGPEAENSLRAKAASGPPHSKALAKALARNAAILPASQKSSLIRSLSNLKEAICRRTDGGAFSANQRAEQTFH